MTKYLCIALILVGSCKKRPQEPLNYNLLSENNALPIEADLQTIQLLDNDIITIDLSQSPVLLQRDYDDSSKGKPASHFCSKTVRSTWDAAKFRSFFKDTKVCVAASKNIASDCPRNVLMLHYKSPVGASLHQDAEPNKAKIFYAPADCEATYNMLCQPLDLSELSRQVEAELGEFSDPECKL